MLNVDQQQAVLAKDRFIFLYAGAGTGKTTVMIQRIKYLIDQGVEPNKILALTFTHQAALHMTHKLNRDDVELKTFHAWAYAGINHAILSEITPFSKEFLMKVSNFKNRYMTSKLPWRFKSYEKYLHQKQVIDYDDLLIHAIRENGFNKIYDHILIDEFQDTNPLQLNLLSTLIHAHTHVFAVGDPDQSIYKFRGAVPNIVDYFIQTYQSTRYLLHMNYRSDQSIIASANALLTYNKNRFKKSLTPHTEVVGKVNVLHFNDAVSESVTFVEIIKNLKGSVLVTARTHERLYELKRALHYNYHAYDKALIHILTIHQAKGLEYDSVILVGLEKNILPFGKYLDIETLEEERRLFFVGITRARHTLWLSYIDHYQNQAMKPSEFLNECMRTQEK